jgi:(S)-ureidoglycine aminohydrolase
MKLILPTFILVAMVLDVALAQLDPIKSALYQWTESKESGRSVLKGSTTYFDSFELNVLNMKPPQKKITSAPTLGETEELMIIKEGQLTVTINDKSQVLGPGSIAFVIPGEKFSYEINGTGRVIFYKLKFKPKLPLDLERGKSNGGSFMVNWNNLVMKKTEPGGRRDFFNRPTATCEKFEMHVTTLNEGLPSHPPHTHPEEEIILLIKGNATMQVENKDFVMSPGDFVFAASGDAHGIRNSGKGQCEYFAFQWK